MDGLLTPAKLKVAELKEHLSARGLPATGLKKDLVARLEQALAAETPSKPNAASSPSSEAAIKEEANEEATENAVDAPAVTTGRGGRKTTRRAALAAEEQQQVVTGNIGSPSTPTRGRRGRVAAGKSSSSSSHEVDEAQKEAAVVEAEKRDKSPSPKPKTPQAEETPVAAATSPKKETSRSRSRSPGKPPKSPSPAKKESSPVARKSPSPKKRNSPSPLKQKPAVTNKLDDMEEVIDWEEEDDAMLREDVTSGVEEVKPRVSSPPPVARAVDLKRKVAQDDEHARKAQAEVESKRVKVEPLSPTPDTTLFVKNLTRPFTVAALKELVGQYGEVDRFWTDKIKTHCYATYQNVVSAKAAYEGIHNFQWPPGSGKILYCEYLSDEEAGRRIEAEEKRTGASRSGSVSSAGGIQSIFSKATQDAIASHATKLPSPTETTTTAPHSASLETLEENVVPAPRVVDIDALYLRTKCEPHLYFLPLTEEQVAEKKRVKAERAREKEAKANGVVLVDKQHAENEVGSSVNTEAA